MAILKAPRCRRLKRMALDNLGALVVEVFMPLNKHVPIEDWTKYNPDFHSGVEIKSYEHAVFLVEQGWALRKEVLPLSIYHDSVLDQYYLDGADTVIAPENSTVPPVTHCWVFINKAFPFMLHFGGPNSALDGTFTIVWAHKGLTELV